MAHGNFIWNELMTDDVEGSKAFYRSAIGWSFQATQIPEGTYWLAMVEGKPAAGIMAMQGVVPPGCPPHWFAYLQVDDVDARISEVLAAGGQVLRAPFAVAEVGRIAIIKDATGVALGLMTPLV